MLKYFTRNLAFENLNSSECNKDSEAFKNLVKKYGVTLTNAYMINNSRCMSSSLYSVSSVSPAFNKYLDGLLVDTDRFPAWTESSWNGKPIQMRLFMFPCEAIQISSILIGVAVFIISLIATFVTNRFSDKWLGVANSEQIAENIIEQ